MAGKTRKSSHHKKHTKKNENSNNENSENENSNNNNSNNNNSNNNNSNKNDNHEDHEDHEDHSGHLPMHANTMAGLNHWYVAMHEKLGWMVLAREKGYDFKISAYKKAIKHLLKSLEHVKREYKDHDRKHDIHVLCMNTKCLYAFVMKHL